MMSDYLDPIAKVWGGDFQSASFLKSASIREARLKKPKKALKKRKKSAIKIPF